MKEHTREENVGV